MAINPQPTERKRTVIWCSCANWWYGGDDGLAEHLRAHPKHIWWSEHAYPPPIGPPWPPMNGE